MILLLTTLFPSKRPQYHTCNYVYNIWFMVYHIWTYGVGLLYFLQLAESTFWCRYMHLETETFMCLRLDRLLSYIFLILIWFVLIFFHIHWEIGKKWTYDLLLWRPGEQWHFARKYTNNLVIARGPYYVIRHKSLLRLAATFSMFVTAFYYSPYDNTSLQTDEVELSWNSLNCAFMNNFHVGWSICKSHMHFIFYWSEFQGTLESHLFHLNYYSCEWYLQFDVKPILTKLRIGHVTGHLFCVDRYLVYTCSMYNTVRNLKSLMWNKILFALPLMDGDICTYVTTYLMLLVMSRTTELHIRGTFLHTHICACVYAMGDVSPNGITYTRNFLTRSHLRLHLSSNTRSRFNCVISYKTV